MGFFGALGKIAGKVVSAGLNAATGGISGIVEQGVKAALSKIPEPPEMKSLKVDITKTGKSASSGEKVASLVKLLEKDPNGLLDEKKLASILSSYSQEDQKALIDKLADNKKALVRFQELTGQAEKSA